MHVVRLAACVVAVATVNGWSGVAAQTSGFTCEDFLTQTAAQHTLEHNPSDPYGLDPDGDGLACEAMQPTGAAEAGRAPDANAVEERPASTSDGADAEGDVPQVPSQTTHAEATAEERGYLDEIKGIMQPVGSGLIQVGDLLHVPQSVDASWVADVALQVGRWQAPLDDAIALDPPPAFADIHSLYAESLRRIGDASDDITSGLDRGDDALVHEAAALVGQANDLIDQARVLIEALVAERGG